MQHRLERWLPDRIDVPTAEEPLRPPLPALAPPPGIDVADVVAAADEAVAGAGRVLGIDRARYGPAIGWNTDPRTGTRAPLSYGKLLDYRDQGLVGDIKYLWEPNRHLHLVWLAEAYALTGEQRYAATLGEHLDTWIEQCPYPFGPNWCSSLEAGLRLINWSFAWRILGAHEVPADAELSRRLPLARWRRSIYEHVQFIAGFYSGYSSANNHRIGEAAGVYVATLTWPYWKRFVAWHDTARKILEVEAVRQVSPDGVSREQSTSYQQFVFDLLAIPALAALTAREPMPQPYIERLAKMGDFVAALLDTDCNLPQIGDADDALVVSFARDDARTGPAATACLGAILDGRAPALPRAVPYPDRLRWLLASAPALPASDGSTRRAETPGSLTSFPEGGYHVVRTKPMQGPAARAVMDTGPLGYLSIAAHGHADALSILLWIDEHEFLVDTGTFAYHCDEAWRLYFRGTRAHNTVALDGTDQSVSGGNFMWLSHADARCLRAVALDDGVVVEGEHDGYSRPGARAIHRRTLTLSASEPAGTVRDYVEFTGRRAIAVFWHFAEQCVVESSGDGLVARRDGCWLRLSSEGPEISAKVLHGSEQPLGGWVSRRFGHKTPSTTVVWEFTADASAELVTRIAYGRLGA